MPSDAKKLKQSKPDLKARKGHETVTPKAHTRWAEFIERVRKELGWTLDETCDLTGVEIGWLKKARAGQNLRGAFREKFEDAINKKWKEKFPGKPPLPWPAWVEGAPWSEPSPAASSSPAFATDRPTTLDRDTELVPVVAQAVAQALSAVGFSPNRSTQTKTAILRHMIERYSECEMVNARGTFWQQVGEQSKACDLAKIQEALAASGMPPGLPLKDGHLVDLARSFHESPDDLTDAQVLIWKLACRIYPWDKIEESPIGLFRTEFDIARRTLANFWKDNIKKAEIEEVEIVTEVGKQFESATHQTYLLSWLELPLVLRTGDRGKGKVGLFKLARWFQDHATGR